MIRDLDGVYRTLVAAFHGAELTDNVLTAEGHVTNVDAVGRGQLPYLAFQTGTVDLSEWGRDDWTDEVKWTIPAQLVVESDVADGGALMRVLLADLLQRTRSVRGLPVDEDGNVVPDDGSMEHVKRMQGGEIEMVADRRGPHLASIRVDGPFDSGRYVATLSFKLAFLMTLDPRDLQRAQVAVLGVRPVDLARSNIDTSLPPELQMVPRFEDSERKAVGRFTEPYPYVIKDGRPVIGYGFKAQVDGTPHSQIPVAAQCDPMSVTLAALATKHASLLITMQDRSMHRVSDVASWSTSDAGVATVSAAGVITAVAAGTATITGTYSGLSGACAVTVS